MVNDIYGRALLKYLEHPADQEIVVHSDIAETESYPISWFFREFDKFPEIEKMALSLCSGKVLDIGAGTGIHALELQKRGLNIKAIDISLGAITCMKSNGVINAFNQDFYTLTNQKYDTLLMLMNGFGIMGKVDKIPDFFKHADSLLSPNGQLIVDSSDIISLYKENDGSVLIDLNGPYYGEIKYQMEFEGKKGYAFDWLFIDFPELESQAAKAGFKAIKLYEEASYQYLAKITRK